MAVVGVAAGLSGFDGDATPEELELFTEMDRLESLDPPDPAAVADIDLRVWVDGPGQPPRGAGLDPRGGPRLGRAPVRVATSSGSASVPTRRLRVSRPVAVAGALDVGEVAQTARHLEANAPKARAIVWPDVAHMIGLEVPERLAGAIVEFLAPLPRWTRRGPDVRVRRGLAESVR